MELTLNPEEVGLLRRLLGTRLGDLRVEIADTEDYELRQALHRDEATLRGIIARLDEAHSGGAPGRTGTEPERKAT